MSAEVSAAVSIQFAANGGDHLQIAEDKKPVSSDSEDRIDHLVFWVGQLFEPRIEVCEGVE